MGKPYSMDLRARVISAIETDGVSLWEAAARFGVSCSTAADWLKRVRKTGSVAPGQIGGYKPRTLSGGHRYWLLERCREKDFTLRGLVAELAARGVKVGTRSVWEFVRDEKLRYKRQRSSPPNAVVGPRYSSTFNEQSPGQSVGSV